VETTSYLTTQDLDFAERLHLACAGEPPAPTIKTTQHTAVVNWDAYERSDGWEVGGCMSQTQVVELYVMYWRDDTTI
jgi:hypothetical protein